MDTKENFTAATGYNPANDRITITGNMCEAQFQIITVNEGEQLVSAYVPAFDLYVYGAPNEIRDIANNAVRIWIRKWQAKGTAKFFAQIHGMGFRKSSGHDVVMKAVLKHGQLCDVKMKVVGRKPQIDTFTNGADYQVSTSTGQQQFVAA